MTATTKSNFRQGAPGTMTELCDKLLSLIASYPEACSRSVRRLTAQADGLNQLAVAFGAIGFEYSRQLFPWVTDLQWFMMESHAAQFARSAKSGDAGHTILSVFTTFLTDSMDSDGSREERNPFDFLNELTTDELSSLMKGESASHLALIATYWGPGEMSRILRVVPESIRIPAILQIARLQRIPETEIRRAAKRFAELLRAKRTSSVAAAAKPAVRAAARVITPSALPVSPPPSASKATPPPPPVPRLARPAADPAEANTAANEEALLSFLRSESPDLYQELAQGEYFQAIRR